MGAVERAVVCPLRGRVKRRQVTRTSPANHKKHPLHQAEQSHVPGMFCASAKAMAPLRPANQMTTCLVASVHACGALL